MTKCTSREVVTRLRACAWGCRIRNKNTFVPEQPKVIKGTYRAHTNSQYNAGIGIKHYTGEYYKVKEIKWPHGLGQAEFVNGSHYEGHWVDGFMHGYGRLQQPDGCYQQGNFENNTLQGEGFHKTLLWIDSGNFTRGVLEGQGKRVFLTANVSKFS